MSEWAPYAIAAAVFTNHVGYLRKARHYRYYANLFIEVDRIQEPARFAKWYRGDILFTAIFAGLFAVFALLDFMDIRL
jgi:hypothetical protein